jgi:hypothetical protein
VSKKRYHRLQFDWINKRTYHCDYTRAHAGHVILYNLLAPVRQLSFSSRSARMSFSQVQRVFIVQHCLVSRSYLTFQNEFKDTFPDSTVPNKSTISRLVNRFRDTGTLHRVASNIKKRVNACIAERGGHFQHLILTMFFVFLISM